MPIVGLTLLIDNFLSFINRTQVEMKRLSLFLKLMKQQLSESTLVINTVAWILFAAFYPLQIFCANETSFKYISMAHRMTRQLTLKQLIERNVNDFSSIYDIKPVAQPDWKKIFGSRMMVIKTPAGDEKGVLLIMFSEMLSQIACNMDVPKLMEQYHLLFEPSWSGFYDRDILYYTQFQHDVFVFTAESDDLRLLTGLKTNLIPIPLGPCDWVNPDIAKPYLGQQKQYDIVMNSNWGSIKRHHVLFKALKKLPSDLKVLLIGGSWGDVDDINSVKALQRYFNVKQEIIYFEHLPYNKVMDVTSQARLSILLSLKEGSNRAIAESIFCDLPVLVLTEHIGGIKKNVVPDTGKLVPEKLLAEGISNILANENIYNPREWGLNNISCFKSTEILNEFFYSHMKNKGLPWSGDIVVRANSPELEYVFPEDADKMQNHNEGLFEFLLRKP